MYFYIICSILLQIYRVCAQDPTANIPQGRIVGIKVYTESSLTPVEIFYGIPYANAPIGRFRFSAPERHPGWRRTFFAHRMPPRCPQQNLDAENYSEDCLFLNIFAPKRVDGKLLPVMVLLYSETWLRGGATLPCQELASEGVVVITVNYRLHLLSLFTLNSVAARGNLALLDQYLALLWTRENIAAFGGDPNAITLVGHSAGADCVLHHIVSPRSAGLFHRAIIMSPRNVWRAVDKELNINASEVERISRAIAKALDCSGKTDRDILYCMRSRSVTDIVSATLNSTWLNNLQPISDNFLPDAEQYLPVSVAEALTSSKMSNIQLDILMGTTNLEAINSHDHYYEDLMKEGPQRIFEYATTKAIPETLRLLSLQEEALSMLIQAIRWEFWGAQTRNEVEKETIAAVEGLARMETSARWGAGGALLAARLARRAMRIYVYRFTQSSQVDIQGRHFNFTGAVHGADLIALLGDALMLQIARRPATDSEKRISSIFRKYIANFVRFGYPDANDGWERYKVGNAYVQEIREGLSNDHNSLSASRDVAFWLKYLPNLSNLLNSREHSEQFTTEKDESRLRGGMVAMSAVSVVLLLLLCAAAVLLYWRRTHRFSLHDDIMNHH
ncbi:PREDICTED: carboxylesterase 1C isoform X1 [Papilio xuthus]|uniref:Carboxylic ester hydrolase n=3 Tax=Papilio xuthus TaxID=66420 RepID=A0AAJ6ZQW0_PAPXU|nr:PREDICTED: carboxylesterase 1C isoform X1 [Papilio xuthus]